MQTTSFFGMAIYAVACMSLILGGVVCIDVKRASGGRNSHGQWILVGQLWGAMVAATAVNALEGADRHADLVTELNPPVTVSQRHSNFFSYCLSFFAQSHNNILLLQ